MTALPHRVIGTVRAALFTIAVSVGLLPALSEAAVLSYGSLSRDTGSDYIDDSLNNRQWLAWDALPAQNYASILNVVAATGAYAGWSVARVGDAQLFVDALVGVPNGCLTNISGAPDVCATELPSDLFGLFGSTETSIDNVAFRSAITYVGRLEYGLYSGGGYVRKWNVFDLEEVTIPRQWLLYRSVTSGNGGETGGGTGTGTQVPEPATLGLFALGLAGMAFGAPRRRRSR